MSAALCQLSPISAIAACRGSYPAPGGVQLLFPGHGCARRACFDFQNLISAGLQPTGLLKIL
jgi:hypothetical protein